MAEGFKVFIYRLLIILAFNTSPRDCRSSVSPLYCWRNTEEKCEYFLFPSDLQATGNSSRLTFLLNPLSVAEGFKHSYPEEVKKERVEKGELIVLGEIG